MVTISPRSSPVGHRRNDVDDPQRLFAPKIDALREVHLLFILGTPRQLQSLAGQDHDRTIRFAALARRSRESVSLLTPPSYRPKSPSVRPDQEDPVATCS